MATVRAPAEIMKGSSNGSEFRRDAAIMTAIDSAIVLAMISDAARLPRAGVLRGIGNNTESCFPPVTRDRKLAAECFGYRPFDAPSPLAGLRPFFLGFGLPTRPGMRFTLANEALS